MTLRYKMLPEKWGRDGVGRRAVIRAEIRARHQSRLGVGYLA